MTESNNTPAFSEWCLVELFGYQKIVGHCTEQNIAGTNMLRVDVPNPDGSVKFTRFFGGSAIYGISPIAKEMALSMAAGMDKEPVHSYDMPALRDKIREEFVPRRHPDMTDGDPDDQDY